MPYYLIEEKVYYRFYIEAKSKEQAKQIAEQCEFERDEKTFHFQEYEVVGETNKLEYDMVIQYPKIPYEENSYADGYGYI